MTEHWERYWRVFDALRADAAARGQTMPWLNLTTFVMPSPWMLRLGNSVWLQNSADLGRVDTGLPRDVDKCLTYRDGRVYDFTHVR